MRFCAAGPPRSADMWMLHASCGHLQPSARGTRRWHGHLPPARLRSPKQEVFDDAYGRGVPAPIPAARTAAGIRPHPPLRLSGSPPPRRLAPALRSPVRRIRPGSARSRVCRNWFLSTAAVDLPELPWPDDPSRTTQRHRTAMAISTSFRHRTMTRSFSVRLQRLSEHDYHTCAHRPRRNATNLRKILPRRPLATPTSDRFSYSPAFSLLPAIQNP